MFLLKYIYLLAQGPASQSLHCWTFFSQGVLHDCCPAWLHPHRYSTEEHFCQCRKTPAAVLSNRTEAGSKILCSKLYNGNTKEYKMKSASKSVGVAEEGVVSEGWVTSSVNTILDFQVRLHPKAFPLTRDKHNSTFLVLKTFFWQKIDVVDEQYKFQQHRK